MSTKHFLSLSLVGIMAISAAPAFAYDAMSMATSVTSGNAQLKNPCTDPGNADRPVCRRIVTTHVKSVMQTMVKTQTQDTKAACAQFKKTTNDYGRCMRTIRTLRMTKHPGVMMKSTTTNSAAGMLQSRRVIQQAAETRNGAIKACRVLAADEVQGCLLKLRGSIN